MSELVTFNIDEFGVADVRLNRPEKYNALSFEMFDAIIDTAKDLKSKRSLKAVVLSGEGKGFCAGLDMQLMASVGQNPNGANNVIHSLDDKYLGIANYYQSAAWVWRTVPVPVIAALHGATYGGGFQLALAADIRFAASNLKMSLMEGRWGIIPDMSALATLCELVPIDVAKELYFTAKTIDADEAKSLGLVTHLVDDPLVCAKKLARQIAQQSPDAIRAAKQLLTEAWRANAKEQLDAEVKWQKKIIGKANQIEKVMAEFENRQAVFQDSEIV